MSQNRRARVLHHVMMRGIERREIFRDDEDRDDLLHRLEALLPETQRVDHALWYLGKTVPRARKAFFHYLEARVDQGHREDLTDGGLIRSPGGWTAVRKARDNHYRLV